MGAERINQVALKQIGAALSGAGGDWVDHTDSVAYSYNTSFDKGMGATPYRAMFGIEAFDIDRDLFGEYIGEEQAAAADDMFHNLEKVHREMFDSSNVARRRAAKYVQSKMRLLKVKVGDRVVVFDEHAARAQGSKIIPPWRGPHRVTEIIGHNNVLLKGELVPDVVRSHVNRVRKTPKSAGRGEHAAIVGGTFPDVRRFVQKTVEVEHDDAGNIVRFCIVSRGPTGKKWLDSRNMPQEVMDYYKRMVEAGDRK